jgi:thymidylate kinase
MWISIIGASSTGKDVVAKFLTRLEYIQIKEESQPLKESDYFVYRLREHFSAQHIMYEKNVFTIRTIWDSLLMSELAYEFGHITLDEFNNAKSYYNLFTDQDFISPPNLVVITKMPKKDVQNRTILNGRRPDDKEIDTQMERYDEFAQRIKVPKIELDMSQSPENVFNELSFGIDSVKSAMLSHKTIWKRGMFY